MALRLVGERWASFPEVRNRKGTKSGLPLRWAGGRRRGLRKRAKQRLQVIPCYTQKQQKKAKNWIKKRKPVNGEVQWQWVSFDFWFCLPCVFFFSASWLIAWVFICSCNLTNDGMVLQRPFWLGWNIFLPSTSISGLLSGFDSFQVAEVFCLFGRWRPLNNQRAQVGRWKGCGNAMPAGPTCPI